MMLDYFYGQSGELFSYFRIPKALFQDSRFRQLSTDARTLYGILLDRMSLSVKNNWLDEQGRVYIIYTVREVQESLCCAEHKAVKLFRELEQADLIERKRRGLGRPSLIFVKNFSTEVSKMHPLNCANSNSGAVQNAVQEQPKPQCNKTDCGVYHEADRPDDSECWQSRHPAVSGKDGWRQTERPYAPAAESRRFQRGNRQNQYQGI